MFEKCGQICGLQQLQHLRLLTVARDVIFFCSEIYYRTSSQNKVSFFIFRLHYCFF